MGALRSINSAGRSANNSLPVLAKFSLLVALARTGKSTALKPVVASPSFITLLHPVRSWRLCIVTTVKMSIPMCCTGILGALLGDDVVTAEPGTWVFKPRGQWHTFWNAGDTPCEIIEVISPAGFENYFREWSAVWPDRTKSVPLLRKYELDMDFDSVAELCARFGLTSMRSRGSAGSVSAPE